MVGLVATARMYVGAHLPLDAAGGLFLGWTLGSAHVGVESLCDALQRPGRGARGAVLDAADVALVDAAALGELRLREAVSLTQSDDLQRDVVGLLEDVPLRRRAPARAGHGGRS